MKLILYDQTGEEKIIEKRRIRIVTDTDIGFNISVNNLGELEIMKLNFRETEKSMNIKFSASNEIRIT